MTETAEKKTTLTAQSAWILLAKVIGFVLNMTLPLLVVRYLSQESVGVYRQAFLVASNAVLVLPMGFSMSAYYFVNREPDKRSTAIFHILLFNFVIGGLACLVLAAFPGILGVTLRNAELVRLSPLIGVLVWVWLFSGFLETAALSIQEARLAAVFIVLSQLFKTVLMTAGVVYFQSVDSLLYAAIILFALQSAVLLIFIQARFPRLWRSGDLAFFRRQFAYALPFGLSVLLYVFQTDVHNYFVSHSFNPAEFAIYSVGCFQLPLIAMLYESVGSVMIPRLSQLQHEDRRKEMLDLTAAATQKLAFFYFPLFCFLMIVANEFITTLFTKQYEASAAIFRVNLLVLPLFSFAADPVTRAFPAAGRFLLKVRIAICLALAIVFCAGLGRLGLLEMVGIVVAALVVEKVMAGWISIRMLGMTADDLGLFRPTAKLAMAAAVAAAALLAFTLAAGEGFMAMCVELSRRFLGIMGLTKGSDLAAGTVFLGGCLLLYSAVYLTAANLLGAVSPEDRARVQGFLRRFAPWRAVNAKAA